MSQCGVSSDMRRYERRVEQVTSELARLRAAIEERKEHLLAADCNPTTQANILEAMGEIEWVGESGALITSMAAAMNRGQFERLGEIISDQICRYWDAQATTQAVREVESMWILANECEN